MFWQRGRTLSLLLAGILGVGCSAVSDSARSNRGDRSSVRQTPVPTMSRAPAPGTPVKKAQPAPGKPGFVLSPFSKDAKLIDVRNVPSGTRVPDPYSGQYFEVP